MQHSVLVVSNDEARREDLVTWLDAEGMDVMSCPGPHGPRCTCIGLEGQSCALMRGASTVLVDVHDKPGEPSRRADLIGYYRHHGRRVIAMASPGEVAELPEDSVDGVVGRYALRAATVRAVREALE